MHPLDMITKDEVRAVAALYRSDRGEENPLFSSITLREPTKSELRDWAADGTVIARRFDIVAVAGPDTLCEAVADLTSSELSDVRLIADAHPAILLEEAFGAMVALHGDERFRAAMARRGIDDLDTVQIDPWPPGTFGHDFEQGRRLTKVLFYQRHFPEDNGYAHPIEGVYAYVDLSRGEVIDVVDRALIPIPQTDHNYRPEDVATLRTDLKPLMVHQPEGPSFTVDGNHVRWQRWNMRVSMDPIEGLILHQVGYEDPDQQRLRSIMHRAALSEMVVPYGATDEMQYWKNAFDAGEWGLGRMVNSLTLGCDCLGEIHYFDAVMCDERGEPYTVEHAICMHEEDHGIAWKHTDLHSGHTEVRRSRRLVISSIYTVGNYEYGMFWYFYLDGTIQLEMKLTGIIQPQAVTITGEAPPHTNLVTPDIAGPHHQHLFCARLDMAVDGDDNTVVEVDVVPLEAGPDNPQGNAFDAVATELRTEREARRNVDPARSRTWRVINPNVINAVGRPVSYKLVPAATPTLLARPESWIAKRAGFARHNLWVTRNADRERHAAGRHVSQSKGGGGLPAWSDADRAIENTDIVVWHTFGVTHLVRPEDFPVMPVEYIGFHLVPVGFFPRNPALDVPPTSAEATGSHCHS